MGAVDTTYTVVRLLEETTYGSTPSAAMQNINVAGFPEFTRDRQTAKPGILTGDRRRYADVEQSVDGNLVLPATPVQWENFVIPYELLYGNDRAAAVAISATTISVATNVLSDSGSGLGSLDNGDLVYLAGAGISPNTAGWYGPITSASAGSVTFPTGQLSDFSAGSTVEIDTQRLIDSTTAKSVVAEWEATTLTNKFRKGNGFRCSQLDLSFQEGDFPTEQFTFAGQAPVRASATEGTGGPTAAVTTPFFNANSNFGSVYLDGAALSYTVSSIQASITSTNARVGGLGNVGPSEIVVGPLDATVTLSVIYDDTSDSLFSNIEDFDTVALWFSATDDDGNGRAWHFPAMKAAAGEPGGGEAGSLLGMDSVTLTTHDPAKDSSSAYTSSGFGYQFATFWKPA